MLQKISIPREVPVMTMSQTVLFPQAMMPLYIFEPRYRAMLNEVLAGDRIFAVAALNDESEESVAAEAPYPVAGVGMVRACKTNADGTSNLILQGLARIEFEAILTEEPFRRARVHQRLSEVGGTNLALESVKDGILGLIQTQIRLGAGIPKEVLMFLQNIEEPEGVLDLAIYTLCPSPRLKQKLLETRGIVPRFNFFRDFLNGEIERLKLENKLRGKLDDDDVGKN